MAALQNPKQELFAHEYLVDCDAKAAAIRAGYSPTTAANTGSRLSRDPAVVARMGELRADTIERLTVDRDRTVLELARIAFADPREVVAWGMQPSAVDDAGGAIALGDVPFVTPRNSDDLAPATAAFVSEVGLTKEGFRVKFHDKLGAIDKLSRILGFYEKDNAQKGDALTRLIAAVQGSALTIRRKDEGQTE